MYYFSTSRLSPSLQHLNDPDLVVVAVAARSVDSAQKFAEKFKVKKFYGSYQALAEDPDVGELGNT
jgi:predicted dehydrogenase